MEAKTDSLRCCKLGHVESLVLLSEQEMTPRGGYPGGELFFAAADLHHAPGSGHGLEGPIVGEADCELCERSRELATMTV
jgi:hypothetical protein